MMSLKALVIAMALFAMYASVFAAAVEASVDDKAAKGEKLESAAKVELNPAVKVDNPPSAESVKMETDVVMQGGHDEEAASARNELETLGRSEGLESAERTGYDYGYKKKYCTRKKCYDKYYCTYKPYHSCYDYCYCVYPKKDYPKYGYRAEVSNAAESGTGLDTASHSYSKCGYGGYPVCSKKCTTSYKKYCYPQHYCYDEPYPCYSKGY
jgi:hypothetical protein